MSNEQDQEQDITDCQNATDELPDDAKENSVFAQAIDVACAAKRAKEQADIAARKAAHIEELSRRAYSEADSLFEVASSLAATATSVAAVALEVCRFKDFHEAYYSEKRNKAKIDFENFMNIIIPETNVKQISSTETSAFSRLPAPSSRSPLPQPNSGLSLQPVSPRRPIDTENKVLEKPVPLGSIRTSRSPGPGSRRYSLPASSDLTSLYPALSSDLASSSKKERLDHSASGQKFNEVFPNSPSSVDYKDSLAQSFDSRTKVSVVPLWEDQYCSRYDSQGSITQPSDNWMSKKAIKHLQYKLQRAQLDSDSSAEQGMEIERPSRKPRRSPKSQLKEREPSPSHSDFSTDSELEELLVHKQPRSVKKLKAIDKIQTETMPCLETAAKHLIPMHRDPIRSVSPLLSNNERESYSVSGHSSDERTSTPTHKHIFLPVSGERGKPGQSHTTPMNVDDSN